VTATNNGVSKLAFGHATLQGTLWHYGDGHCRVVLRDRDPLAGFFEPLEWTGTLPKERGKLEKQIRETLSRGDAEQVVDAILKRIGLADQPRPLQANGRHQQSNSQPERKSEDPEPQTRSQKPQPEPKADRAKAKPKKHKPSRRDALLAAIEAEQPEVWHTPNQEPWVSFRVEGHIEHHPLGSRAARLWLQRLAWQALGELPSAEDLEGIEAVLAGRALFEGAEHETFVRVAADGDKIFVDLGDRDWRVVEISPSGWRVVSNPPVKFRRTQGMLPLPRPEADGGEALAGLRALWGLEEDDWLLVLGFLLGCLSPQGPYPVLAVGGEYGSGKSSFCRALKAIVDPHGVGLASTPTSERDLAIAASHCWLLGFDNVRSLPHWLSDALCRLSTGQGFMVRKLYSDADLTMFAATRPVIINGLGDIVTEPDIVDRSLVVRLQAPDARLEQATVDARIKTLAPGVLGRLLDAVAYGLAHKDASPSRSLPRMADWAAWVSRCLPGLDLDPDDFLDACERNRQQASALALEASPLTKHIMALVPWQGTAADLLEALNARLEGRAPDGWPRTPVGLGRALERLAPALRSYGVEVERARDKHSRLIFLKKISVTPVNLSSAASNPRSDAVFRGDRYSGSSVTHLSPAPNPSQVVTDGDRWANSSVTTKPKENQGVTGAVTDVTDVTDKFQGKLQVDDVRHELERIRNKLDQQRRQHE